MKPTADHWTSCELGANVGECNEQDRSSSAYVGFSAVGSGILEQSFGAEIWPMAIWRTRRIMGRTGLMAIRVVNRLIAEASALAGTILTADTREIDLNKGLVEMGR